jgi:hypothetical protein
LLGDVILLIIFKKTKMKKQCLHKFHSVYYGSEWEVECEKCDKNVRDLYGKEDANKIVDDLLLITNHKKYNFYNTGTAQECIDEDNYWNPRTEEEKEFGCIVSLVFAAIVFIIIYFIW